MNIATFGIICLLNYAIINIFYLITMQNKLALENKTYCVKIATIAVTAAKTK